MWELLIALPVLGAAGVAWNFFRLKQRLQVWLNAAKSCGLLVEDSSWVQSLQMKAREGPLKVRIEDFPGKEGRCQIAVRAQGPPGFYDVRICREEWTFRAPIETGDEPFDKAFYITGPMRILFGLLDAETRRLLLKVNAEHGFRVSHGELWAGTFDYRVSGLLPLLLDIGRRFAHPQDATLSAETRLLKLLHAPDESPQFRLGVAKELGAKGREVLVELAESPTDDAVSAQAVAALGRDLPIERAREILVHALRRRLIQTARACLDALPGSGAAEDVELLAKVMAREHGELAAAAATALGSTGSPAAEKPLIETLQRADQADLQMAAANALARVGSTAAVLPLKELAERTSHHPELRQATHQAIAAIQSRLPGASPGQLSLAVAEAGQLSLAQTEAGALSLAIDPAGGLSLSGGEDG